MIRKILLFVLFINSVLTVNSQSDWFLLQSGSNEALYGVDFFDENIGIVVGDNGIILKTTDGGNTWEQKDAGVTVSLNSVSFIDKDNIIIVGNSALILKSEDGGETWAQQYIQNITDADLLSVDMDSSGKGIVCGRYMTILSTQDMGNTWLILRKNYVGAFYSARIFNDNLAFVFGENSIMTNYVMTIAHYDSLSTSRYFYVNNGDSWAEGAIYDGYGLGKDSVITVGVIIGPNRAVMGDITNGQSWASKYWYPSFTVDSSRFYGLDIAGNYCVAVGGKPDVPTIDCVISESYDRGNTWNEIQSPILGYPFYDVKLIDNSGYIVGGNGIILKKDITWVGIPSHNVDDNVNIYPNPASDKCTIVFLNTKKQNIKIDLYTLDGKHIKSILNKELPIGRQSVDVPISTMNNGLYYYTMIVDKQVITKKISVLK